MGGFSDAEISASARGYIMRCLIKGYHFSLTAKTLSNKMKASGLISSPDISNYLYYLEGCGLIKFSDGKDALTALDDDAVVRLTAEGIRFIENGGDPEMGIDL